MTEPDTELTAYADVPKDQRFTWRITPLPGRLLDARTVGETLVGVCNILTSNDQTGQTVFPALMGIRLADDGAFEADVALLVKDGPTPSEPMSPDKGKQ